MSFKNNYKIDDENFLTYSELRVVFNNSEDAKKFIKDEIKDTKKSPAFKTYIYLQDKLKEYNKPENDDSLNVILGSHPTIEKLVIAEIFTINKTDIDKIIEEAKQIKSSDITPPSELIELFKEKFNYRKHMYNPEEQKLITNYTHKIKPLLDSFYKLKINIKTYNLFISIISTKVKIDESNKEFFNTYYNIVERVLKILLDEKKKEKKMRKSEIG
jgi:hypothetical protein